MPPVVRDCPALPPSLSVPAEPFLFRLANRLAAGVARLDPDRRARHREFVRARQLRDGGFPGREGDSDLYYTSFAVRTLSILDGGLTEEEAESIGRFVADHDWTRLHVVDLVSWLYSAVVVQASGGPDVFADADPDWPERIAEKLEAVRTEDGGYAKSTEGAAGSTYQSFMVTLVYELLGRTPPRPNALIQFLYDRQRDDGGFVEIAPMKRSGTNPTAAAVTLLHLLGAMDEEIRDDVRAFLKDVRGDEGGFRANTRIPFSDGLSTFTGLLILQDLRLEDVLPAERIEAFLTHAEYGLELPTGGFRGAAWDDAPDVEYTFYGLGVLGLLHSGAMDE